MIQVLIDIRRLRRYVPIVAATCWWKFFVFYSQENPPECYRDQGNIRLARNQHTNERPGLVGS